MGIKVANNAFATLASSITNSATSITLTTGQGARFPSLGAGDYFYATLVDTSNNLEIVKCTARSTDVLTVVRAQESTTARAYSAGDRIEIRLTAATFTDATQALPTQTGNAGKYLKTDGTNATWETVSVTPTAISDQTNSSTGYFDLPAGTTAQRPGSPNAGMVRFNTTIGEPEWYDPLSASWFKFSQGATYSVEYLVVAGGGGGGQTIGGGGGAGGVLDSTEVVTPLTSYTITVGSGGAGASGGSAATQGGNSAFSGNTATGGGRGGNYTAAGGAGGSGAGAGGLDSGSASGGSATAGQGSAGGAGGTGRLAGGGGGFSGAGQAGGTVGGRAGNGGNGIDWKSLGTVRAGGGGGGTDTSPSGTPGSGGTGGGGAGNTGSGAGTAGTTNTGGGGGGGGNISGGATGAGGNGGSGIVIIRYAGAQRGTGGTVTTSGGYTYHTFTSSGTYVA